jgi:hypothetical protein
LHLAMQSDLSPQAGRGWSEIAARACVNNKKT